MRKFFTGLLLTTIGALTGSAAPADIYINNSPLFTPPQVDATIFVNRSTIDIITTLPYQAQNVRFWTNTGLMNGTPGFRFEYNRSGKTTSRRVRANSKNLQVPSETFYNEGDIFGASILSIRARNIVNSGRLEGSELGQILIQATNGTADLSRSGLRIGPPIGANVLCDFPAFGTNFFADPNIREIYWGAGRNNALGTNGTPLNLPALPFANGGNFSLPSPTSPSHEVLQPLVGSRVFTNFATVPSFFGGGCGTNYEAFVHTSSDFAGGSVISIAFVPTKSALSPDNLDAEVRFIPDSGPAGFTYAPVVEFRNTSFDIVDQATVTNYVTFIDTTASKTNVVLARPSVTAARTPNTRRPSTHTYIRGRYCSFDFAEPANSVFDPTVFFGPNFLTNTANTIYAASSAFIGLTNTQAFTPTTPIVTPGVNIALGQNPALTDPTNFNGKVEINANDLNLNLTRIKAENFIGIKANNLTSNFVAQLDAPFIDFNVQSTNSGIVISNLAPSFVNRLAGQISAWSSAWTVPVLDALGQTNTIRFHVLVVDNCLRSEQPVTLNRFSVRTPELTIQDSLFVNAGVALNAPAVTVQTNATLALPLNSDWAFTNIQNLLNFTNYGLVNVQGGAYFGAFDVGHITVPKKKRGRKRPQPVVPSPLDNFVTHGTISASALFVRATNVEVTGTALTPTLLNANNGVVSVTSSDISLSNATIVAGSDVEFHGNNIDVSRTLINAGTTNNGLGRAIRGALVFDATNSFGDAGLSSSNLWRVTSGVRLLTYPEFPGDLMGTHIYATAGPFWESLFVWPGEDQGATPAGFTNNLALGRLTLDTVLLNLFRFRSATGNNALYVDYIEFRNNGVVSSDPTNYNGTLGVDPDFTIYFGDSNLAADKLDGLSGGRIKWVPEFIGAQSGTNITYPNGITYRFNAGVVRRHDRDDDGDGFLNDEDCTPIPVPEMDTTGAQCPVPFAPASVSKSAVAGANVDLQIALSTDGEAVILSWNAPADSANAVEFTDSLASPAGWTALTNFINGPVNARVTVKDAASAPSRVYRVRVDAGKP